jgi:hypothetical protein
MPTEQGAVCVHRTEQLGEGWYARMAEMNTLRSAVFVKAKMWPTCSPATQLHRTAWASTTFPSVWLCLSLYKNSVQEQPQLLDASRLTTPVTKLVQPTVFVEAKM